MSSTVKVVKNSGIYGAVQILQRAIGFFLLPVYTVYLSTEDYGIQSVVVSLIGFLTIFYTLALNGAGTRFYNDFKSDSKKLGELWGTIFTFVLINSLVLSLIIFVFHEYLLTPLIKDTAFYPYLALGVLSVTFSPVYSVFQASLQAAQDGKRFGGNNLMFFLTNVSLTLLFVVVFDWKAAGVLLALALTNATFFIYAIIVFIPKIKIGFNKVILKDALKYSLPLLPHSLSSWTMSLIDRFLLNNLLSNASVGVYSVGFQFGNIISVAAGSINQAFLPWFYENMKSGESGKRNIQKFSESAVLLLSAAALTLSLLSPELLAIMTKGDYKKGWVVIPFISFAYVFNGIYYFFSGPLFYDKRGVKYVSIASFLSAAVNVVLNLTLIPIYGIIGAAISGLASWLSISVFTLGISYKFERVGFNWKKIYAISIFFFILSLTSFALDGYEFTATLSIKLFICLALIFSIYLFKKNEIRNLSELTFNFIKRGRRS